MANPGTNIQHAEKPPNSGPSGPQNIVAADIHSARSFAPDISIRGDAQITAVDVDVHPGGAVDIHKAVTIKPPNGSSNGAQSSQTRQPLTAAAHAPIIVQGNTTSKETMKRMENVIPGLSSGTTTGSMR